VPPHGESNWVRHLPTAGQGELSRKGKTEIFQAAEVPTYERDLAISRYREAAGRFVDPYFAKSPDPSDHPVLLITGAH
jgi:hypothetical protein